MAEISNNNFTFFGKGHYSERKKKWVPSVTPQQTVNIEWTYRYITSERARWQTMELRRIMPTSSDQELRDFKLREFDAVAGAGIFSYGSAQSLVERSNCIVIDIDDLASTEVAREVQQALVADPYVITILCFVSPSGNGVKWWAEIPEWCQGLPFAEQYQALSHHVGFHYGLKADPTGSNVNRLCFLPWDNECVVNNKYLSIKI